MISEELKTLAVSLDSSEKREIDEVTHARIIAEGIISCAKQSKDFWTREATELLVGVILHVPYTKEDYSLEGIFSFLIDLESTFEESLEEMLLTKHLGTEGHPTVLSTGKRFLQKCDIERRSVLSTACTALHFARKIETNDSGEGYGECH